MPKDPNCQAMVVQLQIHNTTRLIASNIYPIHVRYIYNIYHKHLLARYRETKTNMTMQNPPFEDVFPIENRDFPMSCLFSVILLPGLDFFSSTDLWKILLLSIRKEQKSCHRNSTSFGKGNFLIGPFLKGRYAREK